MADDHAVKRNALIQALTITELQTSMGGLQFFRAIIPEATATTIADAILACIPVPSSGSAWHEANHGGLCTGLLGSPRCGHPSHFTTPVSTMYCGECFNCLDDPSKGLSNPVLSRMVVCKTCGNKRCPKATDHRFACTGSNEVGQPGSRYGGQPDHASTREWREAEHEGDCVGWSNLKPPCEHPAHFAAALAPAAARAVTLGEPSAVVRILDDGRLFVCDVEMPLTAAQREALATYVRKPAPTVGDVKHAFEDMKRLGYHTNTPGPVESTPDAPATPEGTGPAARIAALKSQLAEVTRERDEALRVISDLTRKLHGRLAPCDHDECGKVECGRAESQLSAALSLADDAIKALGKTRNLYTLTVPLLRAHDDIIARRAALSTPQPAEDGGAVARAVAEEREACAKLADERGTYGYDESRRSANFIAAQIRARSSRPVSGLLLNTNPGIPLPASETKGGE